MKAAIKALKSEQTLKELINEKLLETTTTTTEKPTKKPFLKKKKFTNLPRGSSKCLNGDGLCNLNSKYFFSIFWFNQIIINFSRS